MDTNTEGFDTSKWISIDVEKVPTQYGAEPSQIAIVDYDNNILYETYVKPRGFPKSAIVRRGIDRKSDVSKPYDIVKGEIIEIMKDKIIIGHDLQNEFLAFELDESKYKVIDTAKLPIFSTIILKPRKLKDLVKEGMDRDIQIGKHNAKEDAIATMDIVKKYKSYLDVNVPILDRDVSLSQKIVDTNARIKTLRGGKRFKNKRKNKTRKINITKPSLSNF